ncbi:MAG: DNA polymerase III subunit delta [Coriobacteriaceae bacterium]|nr:DNA polymerase III subunit delta [Coriobacteriaceae bacterium]
MRPERTGGAVEDLLPAYLIVGTDELKRSVAVKRMRDRLEGTGMAEFNIDERDMTRDVAIDDIIASLNTLPMGTDFRLVILFGCDRLAKAVSEPLVEYLANPSPTTVCLLVADKLAKNTRLYKAVTKIGAKAVVNCAPKKSWELPAQVAAMARSFGKTMPLPAAEELVERAGENTRLLENELRRLAQQVPAPVIEVADVKRLVVRTAEAKPWGLLDALAARDLPRALELLELQPKGTEIRLYMLLVGRIRELIVAKALDARGAGRELASYLKVQGWQVKNHLIWSRRFSMAELTDALDAACDLELALKGSRDSNLALRLWITRVITG